MGSSQSVDELIAEAQEALSESRGMIEGAGDTPEFAVTLVGNSVGKSFTSHWLEDAESTAFDVIRALSDIVDAIDEDQFRNTDAERGQIIGVMRGSLEALQSNPDVEFTDSVDMEAEF